MQENPNKFGIGHTNLKSFYIIRLFNFDRRRTQREDHMSDMFTNLIAAHIKQHESLYIPLSTSFITHEL